MKLWTEQDIQRVKDLAEAGYTASQIATRIGGKTRNSIIGIIHRNGLKLQRAGQYMARDKQSAPKPPKPKADKLPFGRDPFIPKKKFKEPPARESEYHDNNKTLMDLRLFDCRAVIGAANGVDTLFCGDPAVEGSSWCERHRKIYVVESNRNEQKTVPSYVEYNKKTRYYR